MEPKNLSALNGAPTFTLTADQIPELKGVRSGHVCDFDLKAKLVSVDNGTYTFRWETLEMDEPAEENPKLHDWMSQFKKAVYTGEPKAPRKVTYVRTDTGPSVS